LKSVRWGANLLCKLQFFADHYNKPPTADAYLIFVVAKLNTLKATQSIILLRIFDVLQTTDVNNAKITAAFGLRNL
jgi:hypothetical protein